MNKGNLNFPIFYSPLLHHGKCKNNKSANKKALKKKKDLNAINKPNPISQLIKGSPTYTFNVSSLNKSKSQLLHDEPVYDEKIQCVTNFLLYPELMIAKQIIIPQEISDIANLPNIPAEDHSEKIHCICHKKATTLPMAMCSVCNCWSHLSCYNINEDRVPDVFICLYCQYKLVLSMKRQIDMLLEQMRHLLDNQYIKLLPIEEKIVKFSKDIMIQINGISHLNFINKKLVEYTDGLHLAWQQIYDAVVQIENIMTSIIWERTDEYGDTDDEYTDDQKESNNDDTNDKK